MAQKAIREYDAKRLLAAHWREFMPDLPPYQGKVVAVDPTTNLNDLPDRHPWLLDRRLVAKPDVLAGKRGKHGLVLLDASWPDVVDWLKEQRCRATVIDGVAGELTHFVIEPFIATQGEYYIAIRTEDDADVLLFSRAGGMDVESNWSQVKSWRIPVWPPAAPSTRPIWLSELASHLASLVPAPHVPLLTAFAAGLHRMFVALGFAFMEINPLTINGDSIVPLDAKARLDDAASFECAARWGELAWPAPFGRATSPAEHRVEQLDARTGASLKLVILNPAGTVWTMVAGGGASVIYTDTIADLGFAGQLANYGEYSGNPSTADTYAYACEVLGLMTATRAPAGQTKHLLIGGGIANFTDVAETFAGIIQALHQFAARLRETPVSIYVRRGGPNFAEGLRQIEAACHAIGVPVRVFGPELHMTRIVTMALVGSGTEEDRR